MRNVSGDRPSPVSSPTSGMSHNLMVWNSWRDVPRYTHVCKDEMYASGFAFATLASIPALSLSSPETLGKWRWPVLPQSHPGVELSGLIHRLC